MNRGVGIRDGSHRFDNTAIQSSSRLSSEICAVNIAQTYEYGFGIFKILERKKERKKSLTMRACEGHRVINGYAAMYWRGGSLIEGN